MSGVLLLLCSCRTIPVMEIIPPPSSTPITLALSSKLPTVCRYAPASAAVVSSTMSLQNADIFSLYNRQEQLFDLWLQVYAGSQSSLLLTVQKWINLHDALSLDLERSWSQESDLAYRNIVSQLLDGQQIADLAKYERRGMAREMAWGKLKLSAEQQKEIQALYLEALQKTHPAWYIPSVIPEDVHSRLDETLNNLSNFMKQADSVLSSLSTLQEELKSFDKKIRDEEREILWLKAKLKAAGDLPEQIRLRKDIADKNAEMEQFRILVAQQQLKMCKYTWRESALQSLCQTAIARRQFLESVHSAHLQILHAANQLQGKTASGLSGPYDQCFSALSAAMQSVAQHKNLLPPEITGRLDDLIRRHE